jgi:hypothetical protein
MTNDRNSLIVCPSLPEEEASISRAWKCLENVVNVMGSEQTLELATSLAKVFGRHQNDEVDVDWITFSKGRAISIILKGIIKKVQIGEDNDSFHQTFWVGWNYEEIYYFGQKLVRWNRLMERLWLDRLFARKGPLDTVKMIVILNDAVARWDAWDTRLEDALDV